MLCMPRCFHAICHIHCDWAVCHSCCLDNKHRCSRHFANSLIQSNLVCSYQALQRLNDIWTGYAEQMLSLHSHVAATVLALDMHGCACTIQRSSNPMHCNVCGIIVKESASMWHIVTEEDKCISCGKSGCDIQFSVGPHRITMLATGSTR